MSAIKWVAYLLSKPGKVSVQCHFKGNASKQIEIRKASGNVSYD